MADQDNVQPMDLSEEEHLSLPLLSSDLLLQIKQVQAEHGLKHADYKRYRQYCTRRLRKLYSGLKITHGRGRYQKKELGPSIYVSERHLQIPLVNAERAWACAMELKHREQRLTSGERHYMLLKLSKAEKWARELARMSSIRCCPRTALEAESYSALMSGALQTERENDWKAALKRFKRAEAILEELVKDANFEQQSVVRQYLKEIEPNVRYCEYQMARMDSSGQPATPTTPSSPNLKALKARLAENSGGNQAQQPNSETKPSSTFSWRGATYTITLEKVSMSLAEASKTIAKLKTSEETTGQYDELILLCDEAIQSFKEASSLVHTTYILGDQIPEVKEEAEGLVRAIQGQKIEIQLKRYRFLIGNACATFQSQQIRTLTGGRGQQTSQNVPASDRSSKKKQRPLKAEDIVKLYDAQDSLVAELAQLAHALPAAQSEQLLEECTLYQDAIRAGQFTYVAYACIHRDKHATAVAAGGMAVDKATEALGNLEVLVVPDKAMEQDLVQIQAKARAHAGLAVAEWYSSSATTAGSVPLGKLSLDEGQASNTRRSHFMPQSLNQWKSFAGSMNKAESKIYRIPPNPRPAPVRPFTLDAAHNYIEMPPLDGLYTKSKEAKSTFSRLFGWSS